MKSIPRYVYISPMVFLLVFFAWALGRLWELAILFSVVTIHEGSHILAAKIFKIKLERILFTPIGIMAKLKQSSFDKQSHEIVVAAAGPISNIVMTLAGYTANSYFLDKSEIMSFFILANISLFCLNILPVLPLDGGRIFKSIMLAKLGYNRTIKLFTVLSTTVSAVLAILGIYQLFEYWYNLSLLFIGVFIYTSMYKEREEMQYALMREIVNKQQAVGQSESYRTESIISFEWKRAIDVIKNFYSNTYHIVKVYDSDMMHKFDLSETEIFEGLVEYGFNVTLGKVYEQKINKQNNDCNDG